MERKLLVGVLGNPGAGKSRTWDEMFGHKVHTGKKTRKLEINGLKIPVFLINESPLERHTKLEYILPGDDPKIVISSFLYHKDVKNNFDFFIKHGYEIYVQWLNPGFSDPNEKALFYSEGIINYLMEYGATVSVKNGKNIPELRVEELKNFIYAWHVSQNKSL